VYNISKIALGYPREEIFAIIIDINDAIMCSPLFIKLAISILQI